MTGRVQGVANRFEQAALPGFYRIWCGLHQLEIKLQSFFVSLMSDQFYSTLTSLIAYLRKQQKLIKDMKTKAPTASDTHWESMGKVSEWFKMNRVDVLAYLNIKKPCVAPSPSWWIVIMFIQKISAEATITFRSLEGITIIVSQQREGLRHLHDVYARLFNARGPLPVLPHQLVSLRGREFSNIVKIQVHRLRTKWPSAKIDIIEQEF